MSRVHADICEISYSTTDQNAQEQRYRYRQDKLRGGCFFEGVSIFEGVYIFDVLFWSGVNIFKGRVLFESGVNIFKGRVLFEVVYLFEECLF